MPIPTSIRDNRSRGSAGDFLKTSITEESALSFVSAYFTVHAFNRLSTSLNEAGGLRFLFGEPSFVSQVDPDKADSKRFSLTEAGLGIQNALPQRALARACADWIREKVEIRSVVRSGFLHGKMYHIQNGNASQAMLGSSNFTVPGLGLHPSPPANNVELNVVIDSDRDRADLLAWFDELWKDKTLVEDVKEEVLRHLERLYGNQSPQFVYYLTLFHIFLLDFLDYLNANEEALKKAEPGLCAIVRPDPAIPQCQPGVIFCFRQTGDDTAQHRASSASQINPLRPHFLVYVLDSGDARLTFAQPKATLQLFRELAAGKPKADDTFCDLFDDRTSNGTDMAHYSDLARRALDSIRRTFERRAATGLLSSRSGLLPTSMEQPTETDEGFELLTWLVILDPSAP